jgi:hypothetical protein
VQACLSEGARPLLQVKTFHDSDFLKQLELAITYGQPFLFEGAGMRSLCVACLDEWMGACCLCALSRLG